MLKLANAILEPDSRFRDFVVHAGTSGESRPMKGLLPSFFADDDLYAPGRSLCEVAGIKPRSTGSSSLRM
jgi:hypothetical protein